MAQKTIATDAAPKAIGPYSQAVQAGNFVFLSGQIPLDPKTGELVTGTIEEETARVIENLRAVLAAANCTFANVVRTTIYLTSLGDFAAVNGVYGKAFDGCPTLPARATVEVKALPRGCRVEIDAIAVTG
ncbi:MAG TPA: RidA family protein [Polyangiaceae bacterium]